MNTSFQRAREPTLPEINELIARSKSYWPWTPAYLHAALPLHILSVDYLQKNYCVEVRDDAGALVGFGSLAGQPPSLLLDNLWIEPALIGKGIGRAAFLYLRQAATHRGAAVLLRCSPI